MKRSGGFTLIELVIVVALIALLTTLAVPSYQAFIARAARSEAMTAMTRVATAQERFLFTFGRYSSLIAGAPGTDPDTAGLGLAATTLGSSGNNRYYNLTLTVAPDGLSYDVFAQPMAAQVGDACGVLTLTSAGVRGAARSDCW